MRVNYSSITLLHKSHMGSFPCVDSLNDAPVWQAGKAANREFTGLERLETEPAKIVRDIRACRQVHTHRHSCRTVSGKVKPSGCNLLFLANLQSALGMPLH